MQATQTIHCKLLENRDFEIVFIIICSIIKVAKPSILLYYIVVNLRIEQYRETHYNITSVSYSSVDYCLLLCHPDFLNKTCETHKNICT